MELIEQIKHIASAVAAAAAAQELSVATQDIAHNVTDVARRSDAEAVAGDEIDREQRSDQRADQLVRRRALSDGRDPGDAAHGEAPTLTA